MNVERLLKLIEAGKIRVKVYDFSLGAIFSIGVILFIPNSLFFLSPNKCLSLFSIILMYRFNNPFNHIPSHYTTRRITIFRIGNND